jgi:hypothetical protein
VAAVNRQTETQKSASNIATKKKFSRHARYDAPLERLSDL